MNQSNGLIKKGQCVLVVIDGCRPDSLGRDATPSISRLQDMGAYTLQAHTVTPSITLPAHFSIFTGMRPSNHGVLGNTGAPAVSPSCPSLFTLLACSGKKCASFYNWEYLRELAPPGMLDASVFLNTIGEESGDMAIAHAAGDYITAHDPDFCFVYFGCADEFGHAYSWMSDEYLQAVTRADAALGRLMEYLLTDQGVLERNLILLSDHGGHGKGHHDAIPQNLLVPWIAAGPDIKQLGPLSEEVSLLDTAPTISRIMECPVNPGWLGKSLDHILRGG